MEKSQQEMQEKLNQVLEMMASFVKGKGVAENPSLQGGHMPQEASHNREDPLILQDLLPYMPKHPSGHMYP